MQQYEIRINDESGQPVDVVVEANSPEDAVKLATNAVFSPGAPLPQDDLLLPEIEDESDVIQDESLGGAVVRSLLGAIPFVGDDLYNDPTTVRRSQLIMRNLMVGAADIVDMGLGVLTKPGQAAAKALDPEGTSLALHGLSQIDDVLDLSDAIEGMFGEAGKPISEGEERLASATRVLGSVPAGMGVGGAMKAAGTAGSRLTKVGGWLTEQPGLQLVSAGTGEGARQVVEANGGGLELQIMAALLGSLSPGVGREALRFAGNKLLIGDAKDAVVQSLDDIAQINKQLRLLGGVEESVTIMPPPPSRATSVLKGAVGAVGPMRKAARVTREQLSGALRRVGEWASGDPSKLGTAVEAGAAIRQGISKMRHNMLTSSRPLHVRQNSAIVNDVREVRGVLRLPQIGTQVADDLELGVHLKGRNGLEEAVSPEFRTRVESVFDDMGILSVWHNLAKGVGADTLSVDHLAAVRMAAFDELVNPSTLNWKHLNEVRGIYMAATNDLASLAKKTVLDFEDHAQQTARVATRKDLTEDVREATKALMQREAQIAQGSAKNLRETVKTIIGDPSAARAASAAAKTGTTADMKNIMDALTDELGGVLRALDDDADNVFAAVWQGDKTAYDKVAALRFVLPGKEWNIVRHSMLKNMLDPEQNGSFDMARFAATWNSLDDRVKNLVIGQSSEGRKALDSLGRLAGLAVESAPGAAKLGMGAAIFNGSVLSLLGMIGALKSGGVTFIGGASAANVAAKMLGSQKVMASLLKHRNPFVPSAQHAIMEAIRQESVDDPSMAFVGDAVSQMLEAYAINAAQQLRDPAQSIWDHLDMTVRNIGASILGLPADLVQLGSDVMGGNLDVALTSEDLVETFGGSQEHFSFAPAQLFSPGPGKVKAAAGLVGLAAIKKAPVNQLVAGAKAARKKLANGDIPTGNEAYAYSELVNRHMPLVRRQASDAASVKKDVNPELYEEIEAELVGKLGELIENFDSTRGVTFGAYAKPALRNKALDVKRSILAREAELPKKVRDEINALNLSEAQKRDVRMQQRQRLYNEQKYESEPLPLTRPERISDNATDARMPGTGRQGAGMGSDGPEEVAYGGGMGVPNESAMINPTPTTQRDPRALLGAERVTQRAQEREIIKSLVDRAIPRATGNMKKAVSEVLFGSAESQASIARAHNVSPAALSESVKRARGVLEDRYKLAQAKLAESGIDRPVEFGDLVTDAQRLPDVPRTLTDETMIGRKIEQPAGQPGPVLTSDTRQTTSSKPARGEPVPQGKRRTSVKIEDEEELWRKMRSKKPLSMDEFRRQLRAISGGQQ